MLSPHDLPQLLTPDEVAARLKLHKDSVRRLLRENRMPGIKVGRAWRVRDIDLAAWVAERNHSEDLPQRES